MEGLIQVRKNLTGLEGGVNLMQKASRFVALLLVTGIFLMGLYMTGCTKHPSTEQLSKLDEQKKAALAAEEQLGKLQREKADLENQLGKKKVALEDAKKEKALVQQRLEGK
jgi:outer membrane PBP1 activator LpoA protein